MATSIVYLIYIWISVIHCIFVGATLYFFFGNRLLKNNFWLNASGITLCLAFLETYWIPLSAPLQLTLNSANEEIHRHFHIGTHTNIISALRPRYLNVLLWVIQGVSTEWISRRQYRKITQAKK